MNKSKPTTTTVYILLLMAIHLWGCDGEPNRNAAQKPTDYSYGRNYYSTHQDLSFTGVPEGVTIGIGSFRDIDTSALRRLGINHARLDSAAVELISQMRNLRELTIQSTDITNDDVVLIARLRSLESLNLIGCAHVDDGCVESLTKMRSLQFLQLDGTSVSDSAITKLKQATAGLRVIYQQ